MGLVRLSEVAGSSAILPFFSSLSSVLLEDEAFEVEESDANEIGWKRALSKSRP
jgi:hypothetical protein